MQNKIFTPGANRTVVVADGTTYYSLYRTAVVTVYKDGRIRLDSGGHQTSTTQRAMTQVANQFNLPFKVYVKKGQWFVHWPAYDADPKHDREFVDGMILNFVPRIAQGE